MSFADKLIMLRKKEGWSQEELAFRMGVTRQSVSKWEGEQALPDLDKMIRLSELFGVSLDYLVKDETEKVELPAATDDTPPLKRVSMDEANAFLSVKTKTAKTIAFAVFSCILSPIALIILSAISEVSAGVLSDSVAVGVGMIVLVVFVAVAVAAFISSGCKTAPFAYLEKENFETDCGVSETIKARKEKYENSHKKSNIAGACLCIAALIPIFVGVTVDAGNDLLLIIMVSISLVIAGVGVICFIKTGVIWASYEKLLQEGDYSKENKRKKSFSSAIYTAYWAVTTAAYLGYSFITNKWSHSWVIWVVASVIFSAIVAITNAIEKRPK